MRFEVFTYLRLRNLQLSMKKIWILCLSPTLLNYNPISIFVDKVIPGSTARDNFQQSIGMGHRHAPNDVCPAITSLIGNPFIFSGLKFQPAEL